MTAFSNPYLIIFLGAPGSGKGTQTILTAEKFKLLRVEMSKLLEQHLAHAKPGEKIVANATDYLVEDQMKRWQEGFLVEAAVVSKILEQELKMFIERGENIILDGFPRSVEQMKFVIGFIQEKIGKDRMIVFYLDVEKEVSLQRNSQRRICELMRHPILSHPETEQLTLCPLDGSKLIRRALDNPEIIKVRLQEFKNETLPLLQYFPKEGIDIHRINAEQSVANVFTQISEVMKSIIPYSS